MNQSENKSKEAKGGWNLRFVINGGEEIGKEIEAEKSVRRLLNGGRNN